jgi:riboflavin synthase alpha subunit
VKPGGRVNIEVDVLAKYVEQLLKNEEKSAAARGLTVEYLTEQGY